MAKDVLVTARVNAKLGNVGPTITKLRNQLKNVSAVVDLKIKPQTIRHLTEMNAKLLNLNKTMAQTAQLGIHAAGGITALNNAAKVASANLGKVAPKANQVAKSMKTTGAATKKAASEMEEFGRVSGLAIRRFAGFTIATGVIFGLIRSISGAIKEAVAFDRELIRVAQVTGNVKTGLRGLSDEITRLATTWGASSSELLGVSRILAQTGLTARETKVALESLAKSSLAPTFTSIQRTTEGAIAAMRQFNLQVTDLESSLGSINAVAAKFAVESDDIIAAIRRAGGVFAAASKGVTDARTALNQFIATFTSVRATTRESAESIATGLRTIFTRIQRGSTIQTLKDIGINLQDLEGKFVGPYVAVNRLSRALKSLDPRDLRFSAIVEELGGFRQVSKVIPLITQLDTRLNAFKVAQQGVNSLTSDAEKAQKSWAVQMAKVREEFVALIREMTQTNTFQVMLDTTLAMVSGLIRLGKAIKPILPLLTALAAVKTVSIGAQFLRGFGGGIRSGGDKEGGAQATTRNTQAVAANTTSQKVNAATGKGSAQAMVNLSSAIGGNTSALRALTGAIASMGASLSVSRALGGGPLRPNAGGPVFHSGGLVPGGKGYKDDYPATLQRGEYVLRQPAVEALGVGNLNAMNQTGVSPFLDGGRVENSIDYDKETAKTLKQKYVSMFPTGTTEDDKLRSTFVNAKGKNNVANLLKAQVTKGVSIPGAIVQAAKPAVRPGAPPSMTIGSIGSSQPLIGGVFLKTGEATRQTSLLNTPLDSKQYLTPLVNRGEITEGQKDRMHHINFPIGMNYLSSQRKTKAETGLQSGITKGVTRMAQSIVASTPKTAVEAGMKGVGLDGAKGAMFEAGIRAALGKKVQSVESLTAPIDFPPGQMAHIRKSGFFGQGLGTYGDAKLSSTHLSVKRMRLSALKDVPKNKIQIDKHNFASGGRSDKDIDAILTRGEYVVKESAAKQIGYNNLDRLNQADKFHGGGVVGRVPMAGGGVVDRFGESLDVLRRMIFGVKAGVASEKIAGYDFGDRTTAGIQTAIGTGSKKTRGIEADKLASTFKRLEKEFGAGSDAFKKASREYVSALNSQTKGAKSHTAALAKGRQAQHQQAIIEGSRRGGLIGGAQAGLGKLARTGGSGIAGIGRAAGGVGIIGGLLAQTLSSQLDPKGTSSVLQGGAGALSGAGFGAALGAAGGPAIAGITALGGAAWFAYKAWTGASEELQRVKLAKQLEDATKQMSEALKTGDFVGLQRGQAAIDVEKIISAVSVEDAAGQLGGIAPGSAALLEQIIRGGTRTAGGVIGKEGGLEAALTTTFVKGDEDLRKRIKSLIAERDSGDITPGGKAADEKAFKERARVLVTGTVNEARAAADLADKMELAKSAMRVAALEANTLNIALQRMSEVIKGAADAGGEFRTANEVLIAQASGNAVAGNLNVDKFKGFAASTPEEIQRRLRKTSATFGGGLAADALAGSNTSDALKDSFIAAFRLAAQESILPEEGAENTALEKLQTTWGQLSKDLPESLKLPLNNLVKGFAPGSSRSDRGTIADFVKTGGVEKAFEGVVDVNKKVTLDLIAAEEKLINEFNAGAKDLIKIGKLKNKAELDFIKLRVSNNSIIQKMDKDFVDTFSSMTKAFRAEAGTLAKQGGVGGGPITPSLLLARITSLQGRNKDVNAGLKDSGLGLNDPRREALRSELVRNNVALQSLYDAMNLLAKDTRELSAAQELYAKEVSKAEATTGEIEKLATDPKAASQLIKGTELALAGAGGQALSSGQLKEALAAISSLDTLVGDDDVSKQFGDLRGKLLAQSGITQKLLAGFPPAIASKINTAIRGGTTSKQDALRQKALAASTRMAEAAEALVKRTEVSEDVASNIDKSIDAKVTAITTGLDNIAIKLERGLSAIASGDFSVPDAAAIPRNRGGVIPGGGPNKDTQLMNLTKGEYVINRNSTRKHKGLLDAINFNQGGLVPGFVGGGFNDGGVPRAKQLAAFEGYLKRVQAQMNLVPKLQGFGSPESRVLANLTIQESTTKQALKALKLGQPLPTNIPTMEKAFNNALKLSLATNPISPEELYAKRIEAEGGKKAPVRKTITPPRKPGGPPERGSAGHVKPVDRVTPATKAAAQATAGIQGPNTPAQIAAADARARRLLVQGGPSTPPAQKPILGPSTPAPIADSNVKSKGLLARLFGGGDLGPARASGPQGGNKSLELPTSNRGAGVSSSGPKINVNQALQGGRQALGRGLQVGLRTLAGGLGAASSYFDFVQAIDPLPQTPTIGAPPPRETPTFLKPIEAGANLFSSTIGAIPSAAGAGVNRISPGLGQVLRYTNPFMLGIKIKSGTQLKNMEERQARARKAGTEFYRKLAIDKERQKDSAVYEAGRQQAITNQEARNIDIFGNTAPPGYRINAAGYAEVDPNYKAPVLPESVPGRTPSGSVSSLGVPNISGVGTPGAGVAHGLVIPKLSGLTPREQIEYEKLEIRRRQKTLRQYARLRELEAKGTKGPNTDPFAPLMGPARVPEVAERVEIQQEKGVINKPRAQAKAEQRARAEMKPKNVAEMTVFERKKRAAELRAGRQRMAKVVQYAHNKLVPLDEELQKIKIRTGVEGSDATVDKTLEDALGTTVFAGTTPGIKNYKKSQFTGGEGAHSSFIAAKRNRGGKSVTTLAHLARLVTDPNAQVPPAMRLRVLGMLPRTPEVNKLIEFYASGDAGDSGFGAGNALKGGIRTASAIDKNATAPWKIIMKEVGLFNKGGSPGSSMLAAVTPGEYVVNPHSAARNLGLLEAINSGRLPKFHEGGQVTPAFTPTRSVTPRGGVGPRGNTGPTGNFSAFNDAARLLATTMPDSAKSIAQSAQLFAQTAIALQNIPETITMDVQHTFNVHINGTEAMAQMHPIMQEIATATVNDAIRTQIKIDPLSGETGEGTL